MIDLLVTMGILEYSSQDIANHLSHIEWRLWMNINNDELIRLGWTKKNKSQLAPNGILFSQGSSTSYLHKLLLIILVVAMTQRFNVVSDWVATVIVTQENPKQRVKVIEKFIEIAACLKTLGNFNGMMEIFSAFQRGPVARLKQSLTVCSSSCHFLYLYNN